MMETQRSLIPLWKTNEIMRSPTTTVAEERVMWGSFQVAHRSVWRCDTDMTNSLEETESNVDTLASKRSQLVRHKFYDQVSANDG